MPKYVPVFYDCPSDSATVLGSECLFLRHDFFEVKDPIVAKALIVVAL